MKSEVEICLACLLQRPPTKWYSAYIVHVHGDQLPEWGWASDVLACEGLQRSLLVRPLRRYLHYPRAHSQLKSGSAPGQLQMIGAGRIKHIAVHERDVMFILQSARVRNSGSSVLKDKWRAGLRIDGARRQNKPCSSNRFGTSFVDTIIALADLSDPDPVVEMALRRDPATKLPNLRCFTILYGVQCESIIFCYHELMLHAVASPDKRARSVSLEQTASDHTVLPVELNA
nr:hypothetical protein CFP56_67329 [Quercus suber]